MPHFSYLSSSRTFRARLFRHLEFLTYDDSSLITSDGTKSYTYDPLNRLLSATPTNTGSINQNTESYTYDKIGNRKMDINSSYTTNTLNQYTTITGATNTDYTYNNNGNLKSDGINSYAYDYQNRLVEVTQSGTTIAQYQYDILGRRIQKTTPTEAITYIYAGDNIIQEIRTLGGGTNNPLTLKKTYINGLGTDNLIAYDNEESTNQDKISFCQTRVLPYSTEFQSYGYQSIIDDCTTTMSSNTGTTTNRYYYHTNHLGSIIALTNHSGNTVQTYSYDSFGKPYIVNGSGTGITPLDSCTGTLYSNTRLYTGREYDKELQLYYLRARYYNPDTGRFTSRDPIGQNDQINLYTYVANSPMNYVDRMGREKSLIIMAIDRDGEMPIFDENGDITNIEGSYVRSIYNNIKDHQKYKLQIVTNFDEFDNAVNDRNRRWKDIILIGHGFSDSVDLHSKNGVKLTQNDLKIDYQSPAQYERLRDTTFTILGCNTGAPPSDKGANSIAQNLQNHYRFKETQAPDNYIWDNGEIFGYKETWSPTWDNLLQQTKIKVPGSFKKFY